MSKKPKIGFPEGDNPIIRKSAAYLRDHQICEPILYHDDLDQAFLDLKNHQTDSIVAGIDISSRNVILKAREVIGLAKNQKTFSSFFLVDFPDKQYILADGATCRNPDATQLADIITLTSQVADKLFGHDDIKIAMLSFSTAGSGGDKDTSIIKIRQAIKDARKTNPQLNIDGEMQLDAAINPLIASKKMPNSTVAGQANVLICPDISSANILYKSLEQFAGARVYGPILLGFNTILSDLSRGSNLEDVIGTATTLAKLLQNK